MAHNGHLNWVAVAVWITGGTWAADILLYYLGRWHEPWIRQKWPKLRPFLLRVYRVVRRHPWRSALAVRFAYGLRLTLPLACGAARMPLWLYVVGSGISAAAWSFLFTTIGWGFGEASLRLLGHMRRYEVKLAVALVIAVALVFYLMRRRHVEKSMVVALGTDEGSTTGEHETATATSSGEHDLG